MFQTIRVNSLTDEVLLDVMSVRHLTFKSKGVSVVYKKDHIIVSLPTKAAKHPTVVEKKTPRYIETCWKTPLKTIKSGHVSGKAIRQEKEAARKYQNKFKV